MSANFANETFLLSQFHDFYTEVIRLKQLIRNSGGMSQAEVSPVEENGEWQRYRKASSAR